VVLCFVHCHVHRDLRYPFTMEMLSAFRKGIRCNQVRSNDKNKVTNQNFSVKMEFLSPEWYTWLDSLACETRRAIFVFLGLPVIFIQIPVCLIEMAHTTWFNIPLKQSESYCYMWMTMVIEMKAIMGIIIAVGVFALLYGQHDKEISNKNKAEDKRRKKIK